MEYRYDATVYSKVAFSFVISNMVLTFISAIEIVLYPEFKSKDVKALEGIYKRIEKHLMSIVYMCAALFRPASVIVNYFLPQYKESIEYMVFLIPLCAFSSKMSMLIQNDMKVFRLEREIMRVNLITVIASVIMTVMCCMLPGNMIKLLMLSVTIAYIFRCVYAEALLSREISVFSVLNNACDIAISVIFIACMSIANGWIGVGLYVCCLLVYLSVRNHENGKVVEG